MQSSYTLRKLDLKDVRQLVEWAAQEGWDPGIHDAGIFYQADPNGFFGFFEEDQLIAGGSVVAYERDFGFMGLFIVHPAHRAVGIGRQLWYQRRDLLLSRLKPGAAIGMDGVVAMQPFYAKGGFKPLFRGERYAINSIATHTPAVEVSPIHEADFHTICSYDSQCVGYNRNLFLAGWLNQPDGYGFKYMDKDTINGYAFVRKTHSGYKIGPLFSDDPSVAKALLEACLCQLPNQTYYLDIPVINEGAIKLVHAFHGKYVFECARMYHGTPPPMLLHQIYGITSFELG